MTRNLIIAAPLLLCACAVPVKNGAQTQAWMDLQKSGTAASTTARPMTGEVGDKIYERYSNSFGHPIPEQYPRESIKSGGDSSGQGGK